MRESQKVWVRTLFVASAAYLGTMALKLAVSLLPHLAGIAPLVIGVIALLIALLCGWIRWTIVVQERTTRNGLRKLYTLADSVDDPDYSRRVIRATEGLARITGLLPK